jgi:hypothetical protein
MYERFLPHRGGFVRDVIAVQKHFLSSSSASFGVVMDRAKRFSGANRVAGLAMQNDSDRWIDAVFLFLASAA